MNKDFCKNIFENARDVKSLNDCEFYHYMDLPIDGEVKGKWDLRGGVDEYLGNVDLKGKRILELGTCSGFLCFEMEKRGAEVIAFDIGDAVEWDMVPYAQYDYKKRIEEFKEYANRFKNAYWYSHKAFESKAKVVYGSVYQIPEEIGQVDIGTCCSILLHLRDPFLALQNLLRLVKHTAIITDLAPTPNLFKKIKHFFPRFKKQTHDIAMPYMEFLPNHKTIKHKDAWWSLSPEIIVRFLGVLGFEETSILYHTKKLFGNDIRLFTVVAKRTTDDIA